MKYLIYISFMLFVSALHAKNLYIIDDGDYFKVFVENDSNVALLVDRNFNLNPCEFNVGICMIFKNEDHVYIPHGGPGEGHVILLPNHIYGSSFKKEFYRRIFSDGLEFVVFRLRTCFSADDCILSPWYKATKSENIFVVEEER